MTRVREVVGKGTDMPVLGQFLEKASALPGLARVRVAVAYISVIGATAIRRHAGSARLEVIAGADDFVSNPRALATLHKYAWLRIGRAPAHAIFHPKLYLFESDTRALLYIGSGNLTDGGTRKNEELGVFIETTPGGLPELERQWATWAATAHRVDRAWLREYREEYDRRHGRRPAHPEPPPPAPPDLPAGRFLATSGKRFMRLGKASELRAPARLRSFFGLSSAADERTVRVRFRGADHEATVRTRTPTALAIDLHDTLYASARGELRSDSLAAFFDRGDAFDLLVVGRESAEGRRIRVVWNARRGEHGGVGRIRD